MEFRLRRKNTSTTSQDESPRKKRKEERCFQINEKILCYEPDSKLERVLYDAKIRDVLETNKRGKKCYEYLVHFQGWNSSWDRRVNEDYILKDTPENRKLQRDLAEKNQLQLGAYLYRKERKKRKKMNERKMLLCGMEGGSDETKKAEDPNELEQDYYSSSATESHDDDRVFLHIGEVLKKHLEFDNLKVTKEKVFAKLPATLPILSILENFVKSYAIKVVTAPQQEQIKPKRRSSILGKKEQQKVKSIDYEAIESNIDLCKEVADGLRVYFNFILKDFLLYPEEKEEYGRVMSEENLKNFKYEPGEQLQLDDFFSKSEPFQLFDIQIPENPENQSPSIASDKRISTRLRSHSLKTDDDKDEKLFENLSSMASTSSNDSVCIHEINPRGIFSKQWKPLNSGISAAAYKIMEDIFNWRMLGDDFNPEPSMIFGVYHLSRLVVKLPEFLSATPMNEEKMSVLLKYLDAFVEFLEENHEIYGPDNFVEVKKEENDEAPENNSS